MPTPGAPRTAILTSDSEDFFRRMLRIALVIPGGIQERSARARGVIARDARIVPGSTESGNGHGGRGRLRDPDGVARTEGKRAKLATWRDWLGEEKAQKRSVGED